MISHRVGIEYRKASAGRASSILMLPTGESIGVAPAEPGPLMAADMGKRRRGASMRKRIGCVLPSGSTMARWRAALVVCISLATTPTTALADEGGVSFYIPGLFGSLAAVPGDPGWSLDTFYVHAQSDASATKNFQIGGNIVAGLSARPDLLLILPTYTFARPVLGGQAALAVGAGLGTVDVSAEATLTTPFGGQRSAGRSDSLTGATDIYSIGTLKWRDRRNNYLAYTLVGIPVGSYEKGRLANIGTNHWSVDAGGGYTYFDTMKGHEFSAVAGLTYNFENPDTDYRNGVDGHIDWAASQFFSERVHAGLVGYIYRQLSGDSGSGARLGDFKSRINGIGPQVGYFFPFGSGKGYINLKGYYEFAADHRLEGWNVWLTVALPLGGARR